ncbi:CwfJ-like family protein / zinc finger(CCCH-type) family protein [Striga asiatica]|uniref:CwfJ-like family protein / zinc finger(CCCH-type) family protein n=1 Tax=Striga asiatica TaxID=4170 RepID=A0A5A7PT42_STRAF|nr:CwfJ-like family protein / zinc finger(CCCH-type) family protein [Striga asiatica]
MNKNQSAGSESKGVSKDRVDKAVAPLSSEDKECHPESLIQLEENLVEINVQPLSMGRRVVRRKKASSSKGLASDSGRKADNMLVDTVVNQEGDKGKGVMKRGFEVLVQDEAVDARLECKYSDSKGQNNTTASFAAHILMAAPRILLCGDVLGRLNQLFKRVTSVNKSAGPFDALLCVGQFFPDSPEGLEEFNDYIEGRSKIPIPTYFIGDYGVGAVKVLSAAAKESANLGFKMDGLKVSENLYWLRGSGKFLLHGN